MQAPGLPEASNGELWRGQGSRLKPILNYHKFAMSRIVSLLTKVRFTTGSFTTCFLLSFIPLRITMQVGHNSFIRVRCCSRYKAFVTCQACTAMSCLLRMPTGSARQHNCTLVCVSCLTRHSNLNDYPCSAPPLYFQHACGPLTFAPRFVCSIG